MRYAIALLLSVFIGAAVVGGEPEPMAPPSYLDDPSQFDQATLRVIGSVCEVAVSNGAITYRGSGTLVGFTKEGQAIVLSCRHVCEQVGNHVTLKWPQYGETSYGTVVHVEAGRTPEWSSDLALIVCDRPKGVDPVKVADFCPKCGPWVAIGWRNNQIRVAFAERATLVAGVIKVNSPFVGGQSGGALFDRYGRLVGVTVAASDEYGLSSMPQNLLKQYQR